MYKNNIKIIEKIEYQFEFQLIFGFNKKKILYKT